MPSSAIECRLLSLRSFAEGLQSGLLKRLCPLREIAKSLQTSVNGLVDRSGFEPLTSAVQRRQQVCQQVLASAAERGREREKSGLSAVR